MFKQYSKPTATEPETMLKQCSGCNVVKPIYKQRSGNLKIVENLRKQNLRTYNINSIFFFLLSKLRRLMTSLIEGYCSRGLMLWEELSEAID